jgi:hypothetical protein
MNLLSEDIDRIKELMFSEEWIDLDDIQIDDVVDAELGEQEDGGSAPSSPAMDKWETGLTRGPANQLSVTKWSDSYQPQRGKGNPLW